MGAGDLITREGQYEFRPSSGGSAVLFNGDSSPQIKMMKLDGLFGLPQLESQVVKRQAQDGAIPGRSFFGARLLTGDIALLGDDVYSTHRALADLSEALQPEEIDGTLAFRKPYVGTRLIYCRPRRVALPSTSDVMAGLVKGVVEWEAYDPRIYALYQHTLHIEIGPGATSGSGIAYMAGNWRRGVPAQVLINGPGTNIRVANDDDGGRTIRISGDMASNEAYWLDTGRLTVTDVGTQESRVQRLARDNQWWQLQSGENTITVNRDTSAGTMFVDVVWRDAFVL